MSIIGGHSIRVGLLQAVDVADAFMPKGDRSEFLTMPGKALSPDDVIECPNGAVTRRKQLWGSLSKIKMAVGETELWPQCSISHTADDHICLSSRPYVERRSLTSPNRTVPFSPAHFGRGASTGYARRKLCNGRADHDVGASNRMGSGFHFGLAAFPYYARRKSCNARTGHDVRITALQGWWEVIPRLARVESCCWHHASNFTPLPQEGRRHAKYHPNLQSGLLEKVRSVLGPLARDEAWSRPNPYEVYDTL